MVSNLISTVYIGAVPPWLTELVQKGAVPRKDLHNFRKLCDILSEDDVSFYYAYSAKTAPLTDGAFTEAKGIIDLPENIAWITEHSEACKRALDTLDMTHFMEYATESNIDQRLVYRANFLPYNYDGNKMLLLGSLAQPGDLLGETFYDEVMRNLTSMIGYDEAVQCKVLNKFIASVQKTWRKNNL